MCLDKSFSQNFFNLYHLIILLKHISSLFTFKIYLRRLCISISYNFFLVSWIEYRQTLFFLYLETTECSFSSHSKVEDLLLIPNAHLSKISSVYRSIMKIRNLPRRDMPNVIRKGYVGSKITVDYFFRFYNHYIIT